MLRHLVMGCRRALIGSAACARLRRTIESSRDERSPRPRALGASRAAEGVRRAQWGSCSPTMVTRSQRAVARPSTVGPG